MDQTPRPWLRESTQPLTSDHDVALLDLDGVVYVGPDAVPGAADSLAQARADGLRLAFVTNNAARPPQVVADHLTDLGIAARASEIVTSAQAAARYLADRLPGGARVLVVGTTGLVEALRERGLTPVFSADESVAAVVQGYAPDLSWKQLAEGAVAINRGVQWVATNLDPTVPSPRGPLPGNGSLVAALRHATRREPVATGKPDPTMHREMVLRSKAERPVVVGDRLDTDIEGAAAVGCASLLVFSGVTTVIDLLQATPATRPTYISADLSGLLVSHPATTFDDGVARCRSWTARDRGTGLVLARVDGPEERDGDAGTATDTDTGTDGNGDAGDRKSSAVTRGGGNVWDEDTLDAVRALCVAHWARLDAGGQTGGADPDAQTTDPAGTGTAGATGDAQAVASPVSGEPAEPVLDDAIEQSGALTVGAADGDDAAQRVLERLGLVATQS